MPKQKFSDPSFKKMAEKAGSKPQQKKVSLSSKEEKMNLPLVEDAVKESKTDVPPCGQSFVLGQAGPSIPVFIRKVELDAVIDPAKQAYAIAATRRQMMPKSQCTFWTHVLCDLNADPIKALSMLHRGCLLFWKYRTVKDLCEYLGSCSASRSSNGPECF